MPDWIVTVEAFLLWLGAIAGLGTLAYAIFNLLLAQKQPTGRTTGLAKRALRTPYLVIATVIFIVGAAILWKPLPLQLTWKLRFVGTLLGAVIFFASLVLYVWGLRTLGKNFNVSSGFGVRMHEGHRLVIHGPYSYIRHPMYLAVILVGWGGLLIYRTWTMLGFSVIMFGLIYRANRKDRALAQEFGSEWEQYKNRIPGWIPKLSPNQR